MSEPIEVLAAWANDTECSLDEANRRAATYAAFAELIEAAHAIADEGCISTSRIKNLRVALANVGAKS